MFTHHWVTGLRGAADHDDDGAVTLDEAYGYAYHRTVVDTASTAIGSQHPTLRTELEGHGDLVLTRSTPTSARLTLGVEVEGRVTVVHHDSGNVVAEIQKVPADPIVLALVPGRYRAWIRATDAVRECDLWLTDGESTGLDPRSCARVPLDGGPSKGAPGDGEGLTALTFDAKVPTPVELVVSPPLAAQPFWSREEVTTEFCLAPCRIDVARGTYRLLVGPDHVLADRFNVYATGEPQRWEVRRAKPGAVAGGYALAMVGTVGLVSGGVLWAATDDAGGLWDMQTNRAVGMGLVGLSSASIVGSVVLAIHGTAHAKPIR
jgi:hypothetical protein